ncbi:hypothetical protein C8F04DRAFT_1137910 [Mycena alexandri]|uniref:Uncharacterized protein n=1 Tax=Mycena alexandri TaxID=1745969 RepID=A0AAD6S7G5_9AGAR|nr:hypothetical protein C8F04DRAFT_1137910 [Mycena alexandri]
MYALYPPSSTLLFLSTPSASVYQIKADLCQTDTRFNLLPGIVPSTGDRSFPPPPLAGLHSRVDVLRTPCVQYPSSFISLNHRGWMLAAPVIEGGRYSDGDYVLAFSIVVRVRLSLIFCFASNRMLPAESTSPLMATTLCVSMRPLPINIFTLREVTR